MPDGLAAAEKRLQHLRVQLENARRSGNRPRAEECERLIARIEAEIKALEDKPRSPGK